MRNKLFHFHTILFLALLLLAGEALGQNTRTYTVSFDEPDGFSGAVTLKIKLGYHMEPYFNASISGVRLTGYKNGKYNAILQKAGISFPQSLSKGYRFDFTATARVYKPRVIDERVSKDFNCTVTLGSGQTFPPFSKNTLQWLNDQGSDKSIVGGAMSGGAPAWNAYGSISDFEITRAYLTDVENKIESAIRKYESEQKQAQQKKEAEQKQLAKQAELEAQQKKEADDKRTKQQEEAEQKRQSAQQSTSSTSSTAGSGNSSYSRTSSQSGSASSSGSSSGPYKDPALNAKYAAAQKKADETRRRIAAMKAKMAQQQRDAARLDAATDRTFSSLSNANNFNEAVNASRPLVNEFARQGNAAGAYVAGAAGIGMGILKAAQANKARNAELQRQAEARDRIREQEEAERKRREAERERLRQEAFELLISQRHTILEAFSENESIPLSTTHVESDTIYYFIYAFDPVTLDKKETTIYVSNVFAIARYHDGTWPYQSSIENETKDLTPYEETMQGFYLDAAQAKTMQKEFVNGFRGNEGVSVRDIAYREETQAAPGTGKTASGKADDGGLGISIGAAQKTSSSKSQTKEKKQSSLGIPLGPAPKKQPPSKTKKQEKEAGSLGIPIGK